MFRPHHSLAPLDTVTRAQSYIQNNQIKCVMFCEFDDRKVGLKKVVQYPAEPNIEAKVYQDLLLPKEFLQSKMVTIRTANGEKIVSCGVWMRNQLYHRWRYMFNVSLVLSDTKKSSPFISITRKIVTFLMELEEKNQFLSQRVESEPQPTYGPTAGMQQTIDHQNSMQLPHPVSGAKLPEGDMKNRVQLTNILRKAYEDINRTGGAHLHLEGDFMLSAYIGTFRQKPKLPHFYHVPFLWLHHQDEAAGLIHVKNYDISTKKFLTALNDYPMAHIAEIAQQTDMQKELLCQVLADLIHYEMATVTSIFQYSNRYRPTMQFRALYKNERLQRHLLAYCERKPQPKPARHRSCTDEISHITNQDSLYTDEKLTIFDVYRLIKEFSIDVTVRDISKRLQLQKLLERINIKKLAHACEAYGILKRTFEYPIEDSERKESFESHTDGETFGSSDFGMHEPLYKFDGTHHLDEVLVSLVDTGRLPNAEAKREAAPASPTFRATQSLPRSPFLALRSRPSIFEYGNKESSLLAPHPSRDSHHFTAQKSPPRRGVPMIQPSNTAVMSQTVVSQTVVSQTPHNCREEILTYKALKKSIRSDNPDILYCLK